MTGKKESSAPWRQMSVMIRIDILEQAHLQKIDISDTVNRALAERLGIDYRQQKIPEGTIAEPVIIASNEAHALPDNVPSKPGAMAAAAIINADDPYAAKKLKSRHLPKEKPDQDIQAPTPVPDPAPEKETTPLHVPSLVTGKAKKPAPTRKKKEDSAKKFFASMILREDAEGALISKDDLYYTFERWCRDHRVLPVPDKKAFAVTLKNQFAVKEEMVNGTPTWISIRLK